MDPGYSVSTDKALLNIPLIHEYLCNHSYWAKGRTPEQVKISIENSMCFGVYRGKEQVGFARVITDKSTFAYLADVFILETHRGKGLSKSLMDEILRHPELQSLRRFMLATRDAHALYEKFGFKNITRPERWMEIFNE
ncbi:MAG TPA: GNAT family N-acetyltransferase [Bacteroidia bacterium]|jgi:GNAT superfamily N-acetyltransferase